jgi:hypothetical protein
LLVGHLVCPDGNFFFLSFFSLSFAHSLIRREVEVAVAEERLSGNYVAVSILAAYW